MKRLAILFALLASPAFAQQLGPSEYTVKLSSEMLNQIGVALEELPGHVRKPIIDNILTQVRTQNEAFMKAKADAEKNPEPQK